MSELELLEAIDAKLGLLLGFWERFEAFYTRLVSWLNTPAGDLAIWPGASYGTLLLATLLFLGIALWVVRQFAAAYGGRW